MLTCSNLAIFRPPHDFLGTITETQINGRKINPGSKKVEGDKTGDGQIE